MKQRKLLEMMKRKSADFDSIYRVGIHCMVNELYEDDEGFYKNHFQYATENPDGTFNVGEQIPETSSYTTFSDAIKAFEKFIKK